MDQELASVVCLSSTWSLFESFSLHFIEFFGAASVCTKLEMTDTTVNDSRSMTLL